MRYLRINKLIQELKDRLDNAEIGMRVAAALSFMRTDEQKIVDDLIAVGRKISEKQADMLKAESEKGELNECIYHIYYS